jgi:chitinase
VPAATPAVSEASTDPPVVAPYLDVAAGSVDIADVADKTGQHDFALASLVAKSPAECNPVWGGRLALDDDGVTAVLDKISGLGGQAIVSTGGFAGTYLETVCGAGALAAAYASALTAAGTNFLDVVLMQKVSARSVVAALASLQAGRETRITLSLPVESVTEGLSDDDVALLRAARAAELTVTINAFTMDLEPTKAIEAVRADVASVWTDLQPDQVWAMLGVTPMIGVATTQNIKELLAYARKHGLGFVRFWSVNRDSGGNYPFTKLFAEWPSGRGSTRDSAPPR